MTKFTSAAKIALAGALICFAGTASAQDYPSRPLKLFVPFAAGGGSDVVSRLAGIKPQ